MRLRKFGVAAWMAAAALFGCAQVSGLSDDFNFGADASTAGGDDGSGGGTGDDAPSSGDTAKLDAVADTGGFDAKGFHFQCGATPVSDCASCNLAGTFAPQGCVYCTGTPPTNPS